MGLTCSKLLLKRNNTDIIYKDSSGKYRFNDSLINSKYLNAELDKLSKTEELRQLINNEKSEVLRHYISSI